MTADIERLIRLPGAVAMVDVAGRALLYHRGQVPADAPAGIVLRSLELVEGVLAEAIAGRFAIEHVDGWVGGRPTYALVAELAIGTVVAGELPELDAADSPRVHFPDALRESAPTRWLAAARRALEEADAVAAHGDVACCSGLLAQAAIYAAQARRAAAGEWTASEHAIVRLAGLGRAQVILAAPGDRPFELGRDVAQMRVALGVQTPPR